MTEKDSEQLLKMQATLRRQLQPLSEIAKNLATNNAAVRLARELEHYQELARAASGPAEQLRRFGLDPAGEYQHLRNVMEAVSSRFTVPQMPEIKTFLGEYGKSNSFQSLNFVEAHSRQIEDALASLRFPWLDIEEKLRSIGGFVELQSIGHALRALPAFSPQFTEGLRFDLGDWRGPITWPDEIFTDALARSGFYERRGLNPALTSFPEEAFEQSLDLAGLRIAPPPLIDRYHAKENEEDAEEDAFARTNRSFPHPI